MFDEIGNSTIIGSDAPPIQVMTIEGRYFKGDRKLHDEDYDCRCLQHSSKTPAEISRLRGLQGAVEQAFGDVCPPIVLEMPHTWGP